MIVHLEDKPKSGWHRFIDGAFYWRYAALCGVMFYGDDRKNTLVDPNTPTNCDDCLAQRKAKRK